MSCTRTHAQLFDRRLDAKGVGTLFASPMLCGREKGLRVLLDFDFEVGDANLPPRQVVNRARGGGLGQLEGAAHLVLLRCSLCAAQADVCMGAHEFQQSMHPFLHALNNERTGTWQTHARDFAHSRAYPACCDGELAVTESLL